MKKLNKKAKRILISAVALVLAAAIGIGIFLSARSGGDPVGVYAFDMVGMTEYWGDSQESYGPVTTDRIQTVFLSETQTVTGILVNQGDKVKKGDPLMTFDTTLSELQLERKRLEVEKIKLQMEEAEKELKKIRQMVPMEPWGPSDEIPETTVPPGQEVTAPATPYVDKAEGHDGATQETAFICWLRTDKEIDDELLESLRRAVWGDEGICKHDVWAETCGLCNLCEHGNPLDLCPICNCTHGPDCEVCTQPRCRHNLIAELCPKCKTCIHGVAMEECPLCESTLCPHGIPQGHCNLCDPTVCIHGDSCPVCHPPVTEPTEPDEPTEPTEATTSQETEDKTADQLRAESDGWFIQRLSSVQPEQKPETSIFSYYVVFKSTQENRDLAGLTLWQGVHVTGQGTDFSLSFFDPNILDYSVPKTEEEEETIPPSYDFTIGYTAKELLEMRREQEKKIKDLDFKFRVADNAYKIMLKEVNDGNICAEFDGEVVSLLSEADARSQNQPILKVSGGGGFYIEGSVSELAKDQLLLGQEVTVNDWYNGGVYTGKVDSIGEFPSTRDSWNGAGNPTATYYPFTVFVDGEANLQAGSYANIQYSAGESANGIYLQKAFLRTEHGESFVYVDADGRLEKRIVTTGKSLWGSYTEILSGLTTEDKVAFPYGKNVKEGAKTEDSDLSMLYGY